MRSNAPNHVLLAKQLGSSRGQREKLAPPAMVVAKSLIPRDFSLCAQPALVVEAGFFIPHPCMECRGTGKVKRLKKMPIKIPAGVDMGSRLKIAGEGGEGERGGRPGDLYVVLHVEPHPFFERQGDDIFCQIPISFTQAALGAEIEVPSLNGTKKLTIPPGTQSSQVFTLRGQGVPHLNGFGRGDQHVQVVIKVPAKLSKRQKELLKEFAALEERES